MSLAKQNEVIKRSVSKFVPQQADFSVHDEHSERRDSLESYVAQKYLQSHDAKITQFLPLLIELSQQQAPRAVTGLTLGGQADFFLEQYLDAPVEQVIAQHANQPVNEQGIVEVGNLAVGKRGLGLFLFIVLAASLKQAGLRWMVFTATNEVERLIQWLGCDLLLLSDANPDCLGEPADDWGQYYKQQPKVMACKLSDAIDMAQHNPTHSMILEQHQDVINKLAQQLRSYR